MPERAGTSGEKGVTEALRAAIEGTLSEAGRRARAGSSALRPERATQLLDEVARRVQGAGGARPAGQGARDSSLAGARGPARRWPSGSKRSSGGWPASRSASDKA